MDILFLNIMKILIIVVKINLECFSKKTLYLENHLLSLTRVKLLFIVTKVNYFY